MRLSDIPLSVLVALFLAVFVLIGIHPTVQRIMTKLSKFLQTAARSVDSFTSSLENPHAEIFSDHPTGRQLNDFEVIVLRRIAQADGKALSWKQVNEPLLFGHAILDKTLKSLHRRGLIGVSVSPLLRPRFVLSESGRQYALGQGYIVHIQERKGLS